MQLEMGISTNRYLPASGTAGFARSFVKGNSRVPCPPPMITESTLLVLVVMRWPFDIREILSCERCFVLYPVRRQKKSASDNEKLGTTESPSVGRSGQRPFMRAHRIGIIGGSGLYHI